MLLNKIEDYLLVISKVALLGVMLMTTADTVLRYVFNSPIVGASIISSELFMVALIYFSISYCFTHNDHIHITFIHDRFSPKTKLALRPFFDILALFFWFLVFYMYLQHSIEDFQNGIQKTIGFVVPKIYPDVMITLSTLILVLRLIYDIYKASTTLLESKQPKGE